VSLFLSEDHRSPEDLSDVLTDLVSSAPTEEPLLSISGWIVGVSEPDLERLLAPRGWRRAERFDMEFPASALLPELREDLPGQSRTATHADREPLADLMERAYAEDLVERALFVVSRHPHKDARRGIEELLNGELGPWISTASFVRVVDDRLVAATLVNELHGPLITQVMVYPEYRRLGFGADLLIRTLRSIRELGIGVPRLVVTAGNRPAQNLYGRLGFVERLDSRGTVWLNLPALGWSPPPRDVSRFQT
jgi:GNAT superfamily N-acetyltransferase